ncbi:SAM-dependent methyltransferase [Ramlibacter sp.]|uniref:SAM-dependent methyltransferase n=1 Tax=Ramlibacter sp. TaxID=1917967 RepID=UPI003D0E0721
MRFLPFAIALALTACATVEPPPPPAAPQHGDAQYQPTVGQSGKDVVWVPTSDAMAESMLRMADVKPTDLVFDLGAGDGKIAIAAAKKFGANAVGIEYNKEMADLAARNVVRAGVGDKVRIIHGDIFIEDFSNATVLTMYLLPHLNLKLRPTILKMRPGTRVVTNSFNMGDWEPDAFIGTTYPSGFYYVVPADAAGKWNVSGIDGATSATLNLVQRYQRVGGTLTIDGKEQIILGPTLTGDRLKFSFLDPKGQSRAAEVTVKGNSFAGKVMENSPLYDIAGTRN